MRDRADDTAYVTQRSPRLLRTAYLVCRDWATAEDLLQTALAPALAPATEHPRTLSKNEKVLVCRHPLSGIG
ncbi:hypothetical protein [Actinocorallia libanotica]|uniref:Sigma-70-like protein n=1 Tax=Actinocorallia libanotica TaxID=46162 RepID=A0ABP4CGY6_9ACTN